MWKFEPSNANWWVCLTQRLGGLLHAALVWFVSAKTRPIVIIHTRSHKQHQFTYFASQIRLESYWGWIWIPWVNLQGHKESTWSPFRITNRSKFFFVRFIFQFSIMIYFVSASFSDDFWKTRMFKNCFLTQACLKEPFSHLYSFLCLQLTLDSKTQILAVLNMVMCHLLTFYVQRTIKESVFFNCYFPKRLMSAECSRDKHQWN